MFAPAAASTSVTSHAGVPVSAAPSKTNQGLAMTTRRTDKRTKRTKRTSEEVASADGAPDAAAASAPTDEPIPPADDEILDAELAEEKALALLDESHLASLANDADSIPPPPPVAASHPLSLENQLTYFSRAIGSKRLRSTDEPGGVLSTPIADRAARGTVTTCSLDEFESECMNAIPGTLLRDLLQEDAALAGQEAREELDEERLCIVRVESHAYAVLPTGALMEEVAVAPIDFIPPSSPTSAPGLAVDIAHAIAIDSTIRQICLTTPPAVPHSDDEPSRAPTSVLPLIVSRSCYQLHVHTLVLESSGSDASPMPSLLAIDSHTFRSPIVHVAPNRSIPNEVCVLLQDGTIALWNAQIDSHHLWSIQHAGGASDDIDATTIKRKMTQFPPASYATNAVLQAPIRWARVSFASTPRTLRVFLPHAVLQVDLRAPYVTHARGPPPPSRARAMLMPPLVLKEDQMYASAYLREAPYDEEAGRPRIYAAATNPKNPFQYILVSADFVSLCDARQHLGSTPLMQWMHHQSGEPPTHIEWVSFRAHTQSHNGAHAHSCDECTDEDNFFTTHNRRRNEVTLYHYTINPIVQSSRHSSAGPTLHGHSTASSSFAPLRLQSLVHAERHERAVGASAAAIDLPSSYDLANPLVGVQLVRSPLPNVWHVVQLSEYGALVTQAFQHRHDDHSDDTNATVTRVQQSSVKKEKMRPSSMRVQVDTAQRSATPASPSPSLSPSHLTSSPHGSGDLPPWMMPHELKPFHAVNLKGLLEACAENLSSGTATPPKQGVAPQRRPPEATNATVSPTSFSHLLASFIQCFNDAASFIYTYLAMPKTLMEVATFVIDHDAIIDQATKQQLKQFGVNMNIASAPPPTPPRRTRQQSRAPPTTATPLLSKQLSARDLHTIAQLVSSALHAFVYTFDPHQTHAPYHLNLWSRNALRIRRGSSADGWASSNSSTVSDHDDAGLDPYSGAFPQPTFSIFHYHLSIARFATSHQGSQRSSSDADDAASESEESKTGDSQAPIATCKCASLAPAAATADTCCCRPLCASSHCLLLHSCVYTSSPSILHLPWPTAAVRGSADEDGDIHVELQPFQPGFSHATPRKQAPVADLSQDIGFLMSQSSDATLSQDQFTQPIPEEAEGERLIDDGMDGAASHLPSHSHHHVDDSLSESVDSLPPVVPSDPYALQDMLSHMSDTWQQAQLLCEQLVSSSRDVDDDAASIEELAAANVSSFMRGLISHQLALDPSAAAASSGADFGPDMRGSMLEEMEDRAGQDGDD